MRWTVVIAVRALPRAKSRLRPPVFREALVAALRTDTVAAALACPTVARVLLAVDEPLDDVPDGVAQHVQRAPGLNAALAEAAEHAALRWPGDGIALLLGDLPALRPDELGAALAATPDAVASFVRDASGTGTTLLAAQPGVALRPEFGPGSAARHAGQAAELTAGPGLRHDVDTLEDLRAALALGVGAATRNAAAMLDDIARSPGLGMIP